jgi:hypothetical protein
VAPHGEFIVSYFTATHFLLAEAFSTASRTFWH